MLQKQCAYWPHLSLPESCSAQLCFQADVENFHASFRLYVMVNDPSNKHPLFPNMEVFLPNKKTLNYTSSSQVKDPASLAFPGATRGTTSRTDHLPMKSGTPGRRCDGPPPRAAWKDLPAPRRPSSGSIKIGLWGTGSVSAFSPTGPWAHGVKEGSEICARWCEFLVCACVCV